jgi:hypothetical protein
MKKALITASLIVAFIAICYAAATDITGHWTGQINGQFDVAYDFKVDGTTLTGTTTGPDGNKIALVGGVIKDDSLSFAFPMQDQQLKVTGKIKSPGLITLKMAGTPMGDMSFDIKKSN